LGDVIALVDHVVDLIFALFEEVFKLFILVVFVLGRSFEAGDNHGLEILVLFAFLPEAGDCVTIWLPALCWSLSFSPCQSAPSMAK
jgi:hypothetical protein